MSQKRKKPSANDHPKSKKVRIVHQDENELVINTANDEKNEDDQVEEVEMRNMIRSQNRKKKSGGFQSMGLSQAIFRGIMKKGYKVPTPIQRKTIPLLLDGKDVVAMARTGSGKTAAFLIPMFERLKQHSSVGVRAIILSPTRELALQTLKFSKELGKFTDIRAAAILGGDKMDDQFAALHENPDLIIATPGRLMHVLLEMNLKLENIEYVVFDEADSQPAVSEFATLTTQSYRSINGYKKLFEMGFQEQLHSVLARLPESRQTLLFSATLPKLLVDFAKAGLHDPTLIRLDVDSKLSDQLKLVFLQCRSDDKTAALLHLLQVVIKKGEQTVVFAATKHHVEFLYLILTEAGIRCSYSYSALDQMARKVSVAKFRNKVTDVLIVTDLAARGIDIPMLDNVINYNFPAKSKLFVHRVGRVARAGRSGTAYSLVAPDEMPYVIDLHLFLGRPLQFAEPNKKNSEKDCIYGCIPQPILDQQEEKLRVWMNKTDIQSMQRVVGNAYKHYLKSRPVASAESTKRVKQMGSLALAYHPLFETNTDEMAVEQVKLLDAMKSYRPNTTIFEINSTNKTQAFNVMKQKRLFHSDVISRTQTLVQQSSVKTDEKRFELASVSNTELQDTFTSVFAPKPGNGDYEDRSLKQNYKKLNKKSSVDTKNFIPYRPNDFQSEQGLGLGTSFENDARGAVLDFTGDDEQEMRRSRGRVVWDRKKKKFIRDSGFDKSGNKMITESGVKISASYKKNIYKDWLQKNKVGNSHGDNEEEGEQHDTKRPFGKWKKHRGRDNEANGAPGDGQRGKRFRKEIRDKSQIVKDRTKRAEKKSYQTHRTEQRRKQTGSFKSGKRGRKH